MKRDTQDLIKVQGFLFGIGQAQDNARVQKFRHRVDHYGDDVMETACELHNFRLTHRQGSDKAVKAAS